MAAGLDAIGVGGDDSSTADNAELSGETVTEI